MKLNTSDFVNSLIKASRETDDKRKERAEMKSRPVHPLATISGLLLLVASVFFLMVILFSVIR